MAAVTDDVETVVGASDRSPVVVGLMFALLSALSFGLAGTLGKGLLDSGWTSGAAVLARVFVGALALALPAWRSLAGRWWLVRRNLTMITVFGVLGVAGTQFAFFQAIDRMQVGVALLLEYTAPVAVVTWLWLRHGIRPGRLTIVGAAVAAVGLLLVLNLLGGVSVNTVGVLWAMGAMIGAATYFVLGAHQADGLPPLALACGGLAVGGLVLGLVGLVGLVPMDFTTGSATYAGVRVGWWVSVLGLGVITAAVPYASGVAASRRLGSRLASFVALLEVLFALLFAWLLLGQMPAAVQLLGGVLILAGVVVVKLGEARVVAD
ncbi:MAG: DMT family transporter [Nocardioides sp.]|uniref:EamA family transporter n=1 Tax=Nocardioides sp. TaxID=35761 RepID=UPI0039E69C54